MNGFFGAFSRPKGHDQGGQPRMSHDSFRVLGIFHDWTITRQATLKSVYNNCCGSISWVSYMLAYRMNYMLLRSVLVGQGNSSQSHVE